MLAIQGLNVSATNSSFLIQPQLLGRELVIVEPPTYLSPPTPGTWNGSAGTSILPTVGFWPPAGIYTSNTLVVALSSSPAPGTIRYTLNGSLPTVGSAIYTVPLQLHGNATIRAQAQLGGVWGQAAEAHYTLLDATVTNFTSNLPLVIIDTLGHGIPDGSKVGAYAMFMSRGEQNRTTVVSKAGHFVVRKTGRAIKTGLLLSPSCPQGEG
jgi:hypothetical protein